jgi:hypothetical protein
MAHRTLAGGVTYATKGGKDLIGGTLYKKKKGRVLVDGTVYEIGLGSNAPIVLEVEKITSSTYAAETEYTDEQFILLDIYPKKNGTVTVTYGGLTKTITDTSGAENPNAQKVFFGTFNGVSDSVATPASGTLIIEGDHNGFATGQYIQKGKIMNSTLYCGCITAVSDWGGTNIIYNGAFRSCIKLAPASLPNSIKRIGDRAFSGCTSLALTSLPSGLTSIGNAAFGDCTSLALTSLPSGLTRIEDYAFSGCTSLALTSLLNSITSIGTFAFNGCTSLALASLPSGLTSIGGSAFNGCTSLALTSLPSGLTSIGDYAFSECTSLALTSLPSGITSIGNSAFYGCTSLALTSLPSGITSIGSSAFNGCAFITLTSLPSGITSIGDSAFKNCWSISIGEIPEGVTYIGAQAFCMDKGSSSVEVQGGHNMPSTIILPSTIVEIGANVFVYLGSKEQVYPSELFETVIIRATIPPTIGGYAFGNPGSDSSIPNKIIVPVGCSKAYKAAEGWSEYAGIITEVS